MEASQYSIDSTDSVPHTEMSMPSISLPGDNDNLGPHNDPNLKSEAEILLERQEHQLSALSSATKDLKKDAEKLKPTSARDVSRNGDTVQKLDILLESFMRGARIVLDELTVLGNAHPILAVAIVAFKEIAEMDFARRENNKKVVIVVLQMQSMLGPMLQLRNLSRSRMHKTEKQFYEESLAITVECIRKDIEKCGSDIMYFMNRKSINKFLLAKSYEKTFASHMEIFSKRRAELQTIISEYIAIGINVSAEKQGVMDMKLDKILSFLFPNLDTPQEAEIFKFIDVNGGPEKCISDSNLLQKLASKAGEPLNFKRGKNRDAELEGLKKSLREALNEDLDKVLEKHYLRFEKNLEVQSKDLHRIASDIREIRVMEEGKYRMRLKDPEFQDIWIRMNLKTSSVKAKVFVLTMRDYIRSGNSAVGTPVLGLVPLPQLEDVGESNLLQPNTSITDDSMWVLEYIDVAYVKPIVEAMDEDGSGYISVKEANSFGRSRDRPKDMKLWSWIAYWAAGWHINLVQYQKDIYSILLQMHKALPSIHVANRTYVDDFLEESVMRRVEALCRSLRPLQNTPRNPKLLAVVDEVASCQLEHLNENLKAMEFVIQSPFEAMVTISGSARVETWIFPLLYLLLKRYLEIVNIAKSVILDPSEFDSHVASLTSVFKVFDERMNNLEAKFRQLHKDIDAQFHSFSYGMFYAAYKGNELDIWLSTLLTQAHGYIDQKDTSVTGKQIPNTSILSKPIGEVLKLDDFNLLASSTSLPKYVAHPIEGEWFGWFSWDMHQHVAPHRCVIFPIVNNKLVGKGVAYFGSIDFVGTISLDTNSDKTRVKFTFIPTESQEFKTLICEGVYDPVRDIIKGVFIEGTDGELMPPVSDEQLITLTSTLEPGTEISKDERREADEGEEMDVTGGSEKSGESKPSEPPAEKWTIDNEGTAVDKTTTEGIQNSNTRLPPNSPVSSNAKDEYANSDTPSQTSIYVKEPSGGIETVEEPPHAGSTNSDNPKSPTFYLTRTPPHLFRFRNLLDGPGPGPYWDAWPLWRKRWAFAMEAVRYETRLPMWSKKATSKALANVKGENTNSDTPPETSIHVKEPSGAFETVEEPPNAGSTNSDNPKSPTFYLMQTPPHLFRFRTLLNGPGPGPYWDAWPLWRKCWAFAMEAVRYETRLRMQPKKAISIALAERRRWLHYSVA